MSPLAQLVADGFGLPFAASAAALARAVTERGVAVVEAPPGTGKTTLAPAIVAEAVNGRVVVTQPRRVAARAAARRIAALTATEPGELVGYTVRGERVMRSDARIEMVTPGVLLRRLLADPALDGVGAVVLDEVHERGIETDLLVGMLSEVRQLREDLVVVAMSATLDAGGFAQLLGGDEPAEVVDCPAALHPIVERWAPAAVAATDERGVSRRFLDHVGDVTVQAYADRPDDGDVLVFLPGAWEVEQVAGALGARLDAEILQLHGGLNARDQDKVVAGRRPGSPARVIVSTALAESSLTVDGVRVVVDAGLAREPRRDAARGMSGLVTVSCSRASAQQRAGRAGRQGPGIVWCCYNESAYAAMRPAVTPQILTADLTDTLLTLACWGSPRGSGLALPSAPPRQAVADAEAVLRSLGAVDGAGRVTEQGRRLAAIPVEPRWARALLDGAAHVGRRTAADVVAAATLDTRGASGDLGELVAALRRGTSPHTARWRRERDRLERLASSVSEEPAGSGAAGPVSHPVGLVVALAYPERVARLVGDSYLLASGTRAALRAPSLSGSQWLAVADVARAGGAAARDTGAMIRLAAAIDLDDARLAAEHLWVREVRASLVERRLSAREVTALGAIELASTPVPPRELGAQAVADAVRREGLELIGWSSAADALRRRLALLHRHIGDPWPDVGDDALLDRLDELLAPELVQAAETGRIDAIDLEPALRRLLPWPEATRLDELAPERLVVPTGSRVRLVYPPHDEDAAVVCPVKLQECFGFAESPTLVDGRVRVLFHLLSPAGRAVAVTDDLASFWSGPYAQVRSEMRGRYPKHSWPEDPWSAPPTRR